MSPDSIEKLADYLIHNGPALALTGAGCSTRSGIPAYRDHSGEWKHKPPVLYQDFVKHESTRRRYWAGSLIGWDRIEKARPNLGHYSLAELENQGFIHTLITQNVDGLHQKAGSRNVIDLHGTLATVVCLHCGARFPRKRIQSELLETNRDFFQNSSVMAPDGDALPAERDFSTFKVPACKDCGGVLKPDVVFFGETIPTTRTGACLEALASAGCLLVTGTSLMVYSGFRYCREALRRNMPVILINRGRTRADGITDLKLDADCNEVLAALTRLLPIEGRHG